MKKFRCFLVKFSILTLFAIFFSAICTVNVYAASDVFIVQIDGKDFKITEAQGKPYLENGFNLMVPLKAFCGPFGYSVSNEKGQITISSSYGKLKLDTKKGIIKTPVRDISLVKVDKSGRIFVPLKQLGEVFGYKVSFRKNGLRSTNSSSMTVFNSDLNSNREFVLIKNSFPEQAIETDGIFRLNYWFHGNGYIANRIDVNMEDPFEDGFSISIQYKAEAPKLADNEQKLIRNILCNTTTKPDVLYKIITDAYNYVANQKGNKSTLKKWAAQNSLWKKTGNIEYKIDYDIWLQFRYRNLKSTVKNNISNSYLVDIYKAASPSVTKGRLSEDKEFSDFMKKTAGQTNYNFYYNDIFWYVSDPVYGKRIKEDYFDNPIFTFTYKDFEYVPHAYSINSKNKNEDVKASEDCSSILFRAGDQYNYIAISNFADKEKMILNKILEKTAVNHEEIFNGFCTANELIQKDVKDKADMRKWLNNWIMTENTEYMIGQTYQEIGPEKYVIFTTLKYRNAVNPFAAAKNNVSISGVSQKNLEKETALKQLLSIFPDNYYTLEGYELSLKDRITKQYKPYAVKVMLDEKGYTIRLKDFYNGGNWLSEYWSDEARVILRKVIESTCGDAESLYSKITDNLSVALMLNNKPFRGRMQDYGDNVLCLAQYLFDPGEYATKWRKESVNKLYITGNTAYMFKPNNNDLDISYWTASQQDKETASDNSNAINEALKKIGELLDKL